jgi:hypothetical protein
MSCRPARFLPKYSFVTLALLEVAGCSSGDSGRPREEGATMTNLPTSNPSVAEGAPSAPGTGPNLVVSDGWVDGSTNGLGIQGAFFTYQDGSGRTVIAADATRTQSGYCVAGTAAEVLNMDFGGTYGAVAALNLAQEADSALVAAYDATAHGVVGFGFDIVGNTAGALRFVIKQYATHDGFCINNVPDCASGCTAEFRIDELRQNCWTPGGPTPAAVSLQALEWQIVTKAGEATDFDYCIENIHAVVDPALVPAPAAPEDDVTPGRVTY